MIIIKMIRLSLLKQSHFHQKTNNSSFSSSSSLISSQESDAVDYYAVEMTCVCVLIFVIKNFAF
jgi:hypothetical protein